MKKDKKASKNSSGLSGGLAECHKLLKKIMANPNSWPFNQPVDPIALQIPTYFDIIKEPMDLGTILTQLESEEYNSPEEVDSHVNLVWRNARTFNPPNHEIVKMADTLSKLWSRGFSKISGSSKVGKKPPKVKEQLQTPPPEKSSKTKNVEHTISALKESMDSVRNEIAVLRQTSPPSVSSKKRAATDSASSSNKKQKVLKEMTFEEKTKLSNNISNLESDQLDELLKIIQKGMPNLEGSSETIEIELDKLDTEILRACEDYVNSCLSKNNPSAAPVEKDDNESEEEEESKPQITTKKTESITPSGNEEELRAQVLKLQQQVESLKKELEQEKQTSQSYRKKLDLLEKALKS